MAPPRNPGIPASNVPHVYYDLRNAKWHIVLTAHGHNVGSDYFDTAEEAESAQPDFVRLHGSERQRKNLDVGVTV
jgi:hypothetical protein